MSLSLQNLYEFGSINIYNSLTFINKINTVQSTSITSGVYISPTYSVTNGSLLCSTTASFIGTITTVPTTLEPLNSINFTVYNSCVNQNTLVLLSLLDYYDSTITQSNKSIIAYNGLPIVQSGNLTTGSFDIIIRNVDPNNPLNGTLNISYLFF
jgi:hypothetical protein